MALKGNILCGSERIKYIFDYIFRTGVNDDTFKCRHKKLGVEE